MAVLDLCKALPGAQRRPLFPFISKGALQKQEGCKRVQTQIHSDERGGGASSCAEGSSTLTETHRGGGERQSETNKRVLSTLPTKEPIYNTTAWISLSMCLNHCSACSFLGFPLSKCGLCLTRLRPKGCPSPHKWAVCINVPTPCIHMFEHPLCKQPP